MILYHPDPMSMVQDSEAMEKVIIKLPSGGYITAESIDLSRVRITGINSTDPMDYMHSHLQPGSIIELRIN